MKAMQTYNKNILYVLNKGLKPKYNKRNNDVITS